jgi:hypothetical protein
LEIVRESPLATKVEFKRYQKLSRFLSWRDFFSNDVPATRYHAQFAERCELAIKFLRPYLKGEQALWDPKGRLLE